MKEFEGKHVLVTGAAKGIGSATVAAFLSQGARVSGLDICYSDKEIIHHSNFRMYTCDVSSSSQVGDTVTRMIKAFGNIHVLVNNAGIVRYGTVTETSEEQWDQIMNVNLKGAFLMSKAALPSMQESGSGVVINVSSVQAFITQDQVAAYTSSKTALLGLTRSIAVDYAPNIRCVAVCPGTIDTPMLRDAIKESPDPQAVMRECEEMHLLKKIGSAKEVGEFITYLSSPKASFITGQAFRIDGGLGVAIGGSKQK